MLGVFEILKNIKERHLSSFSRHIFIIVLFALFYYALNKNIPDSFHYNKTHGDLTLLDFIYFSLVTQTTVGYGDIAPIHKYARMGCMLQLLTTYAVVIISII